MTVWENLAAEVDARLVELGSFGSLQELTGAENLTSNLFGLMSIQAQLSKITGGNSMGVWENLVAEVDARLLELGSFGSLQELTGAENLTSNLFGLMLIQSNLSTIAGGNSGSVSDPLSIGSVFATSTIRNSNVETIVSATKPTTRKNGDSLVANDLWYDTSSNRQAYWNGTYWLTPPFRASTLNTFLTSTNAFAGTVAVPNIFPAISTPTVMDISFNDFFLHRAGVIVRQLSASPWDGTNYWRLRLQEVEAGGGGSVVDEILVNNYVNDNFRYFPFAARNIVGSTIAQTYYTINATKFGSAPNIVISFAVELSIIL